MKRVRQHKTPSWSDYLTARIAQCQHPRIASLLSQLPDPATPLAETPMVAMDFETTGLDANHNDIISIGLVPFSLDRIQPAAGNYWLLAPPSGLKRSSVTFHRITHSELEDAPDLALVLDDILNALTGRLVVVHYRQLERSFLHNAVRDRLGEQLLFPMLDTMSIEAHLHRQSWWARLRRWSGRPVTSIRLHESRQRYHLPPYTGHHAYVDALATAELLQAQIRYHFSPELPCGELWR